MADGTENSGIIRSLWRLLTFWKWRKGLRIAEAADKQFTGSTQGISDAFDLQHNSLVKEYNDLRDAVSQVEAVSEQDRNSLEELNKREATLIARRDGAQKSAEKAMEAKDDEQYAKDEAAFASYSEQIDQVEVKQKELAERIKGNDASMKKYLLRLTQMQREIEQLPAQKAQEMANFVSAKKIVELNDRLHNLKTSMDRGPLDAVLKANRELTAKARISDKLAGTDAAMQDAEYEAVGSQQAAKDKLRELLAAKNAEKKLKAGEVPAAKVAENDRPKI